MALISDLRVDCNIEATLTQQFIEILLTCLLQYHFARQKWWKWKLHSFFNIISINISSWACCQVCSDAADSILLRFCVPRGPQAEFVLDTSCGPIPCSPDYWRTHCVRSPTGSRRAALSSANLFAKQMKSSGCTIRLRSFKLIINQSGNY